MFKILSNLLLLILLLNTSSVSAQGNCDPIAPPNAITITDITIQSATASWDTVIPNVWYHLVLRDISSGLIVEEIVLSQNTLTFFNLVAGTGYEATISSSTCETGPFGDEVSVIFYTPNIIIDDVAMLVPNPSVNQQPNYTPADLRINDNQFNVFLFKTAASGPGQVSAEEVYHAYFYTGDNDGSDFFEFTLAAGFDNQVHFPKIVNTSEEHGHWVIEAFNQWGELTPLDKPGLVNFLVSYVNKYTAEKELKMSINLLNTSIINNVFLPIEVELFDTGDYFYGENKNITCTEPITSCIPGGNGALPLEDDKPDQNGSIAEQLPVLQIAPNPFRQTVTLDLGKSWEQIEQIVITGPDSNVIFETSTPAKSEKLQLSTAQWPTGIYYLHLQTLAGRHVYTILKTN